MGEGVSLSLPQNGSPVANHLVVSDPFLREQGFSSGFNLLDFQTEEEYSLKVALVGSNGHGGLATRGSPL